MSFNDFLNNDIVSNKQRHLKLRGNNLRSSDWNDYAMICTISARNIFYFKPDLLSEG